jgi:hypothetical protein
MRRSPVSVHLPYLVLLYLIYLAMALILARAANTTGLLTKEEASSAFVNPAFLAWRLQHHVMSTNFYGYVYFWWSSRIVQGLFYSRYAKAAAMALTPCFVYLYLCKGYALRGAHAFAAALAISALPGVLCFSWLGIDVGIETPIGFAALWLALYDSTAAIIGSSILAALSVETYGGGLVFLIAVSATHALRLRTAPQRKAVIAGFASMFTVLAFPVFWWTNIQTLVTGGAGDPRIHGARDRLILLLHEVFLKGDSYYYFSNGLPALGSAFVGLLAVAGICYAAFAVIFRRDLRAWPLVLICASALAIYAAAGNVIGVRRIIPMIVCLGIFAVLLLHVLVTNRLPVIRVVGYLAFAIWIATAAYQFSMLRAGLASGSIALPRDFEFRTDPQTTMEATVAQLLSGSRPLPLDLSGYEPDRTLSILYVLGKPPSRPSPQEVIQRCDRHGWSIPSTAPRFARWRHSRAKQPPAE